MMLLILALALANDDPADWGCADPLIAKNWMQRVGDVALAARIKDECVRPFVEDTANLSRCFGYRSGQYTSSHPDCSKRRYRPRYWRGVGSETFPSTDETNGFINPCSHHLTYC